MISFIQKYNRRHDIFHKMTKVGIGTQVEQKNNNKKKTEILKEQ